MNSFSAFIVALSAIAGGTLVTYLYDERELWAARLCAGACIGFTGLGLIGFTFASVLGFRPLALALTTVTASSPLVMIINEKYREQVREDIQGMFHTMRSAIFGQDRRLLGYFVFYVLVGALLWGFFSRVMLERADGIYTIENNGGDLPLHLGIISGFVQGNNFPPEHPEFAGARLTYPFLPDFIAALFTQTGASLQGALFLENFVLALALVGLLHSWVWVLTRDALAALIAPTLVFLSGGLGWLSALQDLSKNRENLFALLMDLPRGYTVMWDGVYRWGNILLMLAMQRTLLLGLPLCVIVWTLWWKGMRDVEELPTKILAESSAMHNRRMIAAGAVAGLLPLVHTYTFLVVMGMGTCLALLFRRWRAWIVFFAVALLFAAPQFFLLLQNSGLRPEKFFAWQAGLYLAGNNFVWFWIMNTGLSIPLLLVAVLWRGRRPVVSRSLLLFYLPFTLCFVVPNLVRLAPWRWDGLKVMLFWYVASAPLIALLLARLWRGENAVIRLTTVALFLSLIAAGSLDVWRAVSGASELRVYSQEAIAFADMIVKHTHPRALILNAPNYNDVVFLTGRRSLMGNTDHLFSHGVGYLSRAAEVQRIFAGAPDADALMTRYGVEFVVIEPVEVSTLPFNNRSFAVNEGFFERYPVIAESEKYRLYKIRELESGASGVVADETLGRQSIVR